MLKRYIPLALAFSLLCSCAAPAAETPAPTGEAPRLPTAEIPSGTEWADYYAGVILHSQPDGEEYTPLSAEDGAFYLSLYGIPLSEEESFGFAVYTAGDVDAREIAVVCGSGVGAAGMEEYRRGRVDSFAGYIPDQAALAENGLVLEGNMDVLLLCADPDAAREALEKAASPLVLKPYDPEEVQSPYDWTDELDEKGYPIFDPPNRVDMTPYDTTAIKEAWETGDDSGLSEKEAAVLAWCRETWEVQCIEGRSDIQKEILLHGLLVRVGSYDQTVHDPNTPMGREDNTNPYGLLIRGYGICLGYATTFQLLMDLAGVECITVVGASSSSNNDHAWNMVKLEGEWYCVDPTWDDPTISDPSVYSRVELAQRQHRYFNVTSDRMRETDHQWDYDTVPEATATRFRWDGTGELPA